MKDAQRKINRNEERNKDIVKRVFNEAKKQFEEGKHWKDIDLKEVEEVFERVSNVTDDTQRADAFSTFENILDIWAEYIMRNTTKSGKQSKRRIKLGGVSQKSFKRGNYRGKRKVNVFPFSDFRREDDYGNEYYTFELEGKVSYSIEDDVNFQVMIDDAINTFTEEEKQIFSLREKQLILKRKKYTQEECSKETGLTVKQVRGRIDKYKEKLKEKFKEVS